MRYRPDHKLKTRQDLVKRAAGQMRAKGPTGVSIAQLMASLGLTHGGFYAHFPSKDALIAAAIEAMFADVIRIRQGQLGAKTGPGALRALIENYLSPVHLDQRDRGCPVAALMGLADQLPSTARVALDEGYQQMVSQFAGLMADRPGPEDLALASSLISEMVGALTLARAMTDRNQALTILDHSRLAILHRAGLSTSTLETA
jgi:TetR/AcrR family transcriptional repressor of nem operon